MGKRGRCPVYRLEIIFHYDDEYGCHRQLIAVQPLWYPAGRSEL